MTKLIANIPMSIYKGEIHAGYLTYMVPGDILARYEKKTSGSINFNPDCYNVSGLPIEKIILDDFNFKKTADKYVENWIYENSISNKMNFIKNPVKTDRLKESVDSTIKTTNLIKKNGFLIQKEDDLFLDVKKIILVHGQKNILDMVNISPTHVKNRMQQMMETTNNPIKISRLRKYSPNIPDNIISSNVQFYPLFILANMWGENKIVDTMLCAYNNIVKYGLLRMLSQTAAYGNPNTANIYVFNRQILEGSKTDWNIDSLLKEFDSDIIKYAVLKASSQKLPQTDLKKEYLIQGKKFMNKFRNLAKLFTNNIIEVKNRNISKEYSDLIETYNFKSLVEKISSKTYTISRKISKNRQDIKHLSNDFENLYATTEFVFPKLYTYIRTERKKLKK
ncbi:hypothetical protein K9L67_04165 [Candidatus Woesearchaeota archaeon]|nr:hypothetical protein [Candidatus Woesearchaeota archaeon]MCF7901396.1 hypothetical protein [Candidatus Woesearchaeota archaeon]MCF8013730.1 hypothetical protein [Candidatus Woesearchaeota archaeon]